MRAWKVHLLANKVTRVKRLNRGFVTLPNGFAEQDVAFCVFSGGKQQVAALIAIHICIENLFTVVRLGQHRVDGG
jgi:hypothetical protein